MEKKLMNWKGEKWPQTIQKQNGGGAGGGGGGGGAAKKHYSTSDKKINIRCNSSTLNIMNLFPKKCGGKKPPKKQKGGGK